MVNPPPMAEQFLYDLRKMIAITKQRLTLRSRHIPRLSVIDEETTDHLSPSSHIQTNIQEREEEEEEGKQSNDRPKEDDEGSRPLEKRRGEKEGNGRKSDNLQPTRRFLYYDRPLPLHHLNVDEEEEDDLADLQMDEPIEEEEELLPVGSNEINGKNIVEELSRSVGYRYVEIEKSDF